MNEAVRVRKYSLNKLLGEGSQGETWDALDEESSRNVAVKRFDVRGARSWKDVELAERETRVLATIRHPLLPKYIEHFEEDGTLFLVMEKIDGETLESLQRRGAFTEQEAIAFLASATEVLAYLHSRNPPIIHRDIKPRNVIRRADGRYAFVDFGAVSEHMKPRGGSTVVGTVGFMAPEQLQGRALPQTDVYAVGATALAGLAGRDPDQLPHKGLKVDVRASLAGRASEGTMRTLEAMLEPDPDNRTMRPIVSLAPPVQAQRDKKGRTPEDRTVRSIIGLLWVLWGLGWPTIMPVYKQPAIMFVWLALTIIASWHKGAVIRALLRQAQRERASLAPAPPPAVRIAEPPPPVRVAEHGEEAVADEVSEKSARELRR